MEKHDDAPEDVKRATSVDREVKRGEKDDTFEGYPRAQERKKRWEHCDKPPSKKPKVNYQHFSFFLSPFSPKYTYILRVDKTL